MIKIQNPFEITKAIQFTDEEINAFWVDINASGGGGFKEVIKPVSPVPMIILGGKGCGKTHVAKYYSYESQRKRKKSNIKSLITEEGFIGIYFLLGGLNEGRFKGNGISQDVWNAVFLYYMDISIAIRTLHIIHTFLQDSGLSLDDESSFCDDVSKVFTKQNNFGKTLEDLITSLDDIRKNLDSNINNSVTTRKIEVDLQLTRGRLVLSIPELLSKHSSFFNGKKILYIFDEIENIDIYGQKYFQTLIRETRPSIAIKLSGRLYSLKTRETFCDGESNMEGSEFELLELDRFLRDNYNSFVNFVLRLCQRRVEKIYPTVSSVEIFENKFESWNNVNDSNDESSTTDRLGDFALKELSGTECVHMTRFKGVLIAARIPDDVQNKLICLLSCSQHPLVEKFNIFLFYKEWAKIDHLTEENLIEIAKGIQSESKLFIDGKKYKQSIHQKSHFRADIIAQMCKENSKFVTKFKREYYSGLKTFVRLSGGMPRPLLLLLKSTFMYSLEETNPFVDDAKISFEAQRRAIVKTSHWFFEDATNCEDLEALQRGIEHLALFFKEMRYSDKPAECSCISFSYKQEQVSAEALRVIESARTRSLLFEIWDGRKSKSSSKIERMFQLNPILSPKWDLAIVRRGTIPLSGDFVNSMFDSSFYENYVKLKNDRLRAMQAPFVKWGAKSNDLTPSLF